MSRVVLDTVVVTALIDERDTWHKQSVALRDALKAANVEFVVFDPVVNEVVSVIARRLHEQGRSLSSGSLAFLSINGR